MHLQALQLFPWHFEMARSAEEATWQLRRALRGGGGLAEVRQLPPRPALQPYVLEAAPPRLSHLQLTCITCITCISLAARQRLRPRAILTMAILQCAMAVLTTGRQLLRPRTRHLRALRLRRGVGGARGWHPPQAVATVCGGLSERVHAQGARPRRPCAARSRAARRRARREIRRAPAGRCHRASAGDDATAPAALATLVALGAAAHVGARAPFRSSATARVV